MTQQEAEIWNAKYPAFYVTRYSPKSGRQVQIGKPHRCIRAALEAAKRADGYWMTFVDTTPPRAR